MEPMVVPDVPESCWSSVAEPKEDLIRIMLVVGDDKHTGHCPFQVLLHARVEAGGGHGDAQGDNVCGARFSTPTCSQHLERCDMLLARPIIF